VVSKHESTCELSDFIPDYAVLSMAIHSALQVFSPVSTATPDGLHPWRLYVYAGAFLIPVLTASLAFVNPNLGYESLGAFCTLPIRPFWYRLALAWIPRYLIALVIIGIAIAINFYVRLELRSINWSIIASQITQLPQKLRDGSHTRTVIAVPHVEQRSPPNDRRDNVSLPNVSSKRHISSSLSMCADPDARSSAFAPYTSTKSILGDTAEPKLSEALFSCSSEQSGCTAADVRIASASSILVDTSDTVLQKPDFCSNPERRSRSETAFSSTPRHHLRIRHQLRLVFIYPLVYTLMWILPFVNHCTMYSDGYAQHPLWALRFGAAVCISSMGFIDCLVFFLRERPWLSSAATDETFRGSLTIRKSNVREGTRSGYSHTSWKERCKQTMQPPAGARNLTFLQRVESAWNIRTRQRPDDFARIAAAQARVRLHLERAERLTTQSEGSAVPVITEGVDDRGTSAKSQCVDEDARRIL
jgi:hypothetical protein